MTRYRFFGLCLLALVASQADAVVIYRFGGQQLPPPAEVGSAGVEFVQLSWEEIDPAAGGGATDLDITAGAIRAQRRDPQINIAPTAEERGGSFIRSRINGQVWDGNTSSIWEAVHYLCADFLAYDKTCIDDFGTLGTANIDLGGRFQIDRIRVISGLRTRSRMVQSLRVYLSQTMPFVNNNWHPPPFSPHLVEVRDNREQVLDIPIPPHEEAGFVQITLGEHNEDWEVHDIQVFAKGFVKRSTFTSNIIDFGRPMAWGELRWVGSKGERARLLVQTRSGGDDDPVRYWRDTGRDNLEEVSSQAYAGLKVGERAGTSYDQDNWSFWSSYDFADSLGTQIVSESPRRYLQVQVDFVPRENDGAELEYLEFRASTPVATALVGEIWPVEARVGERTNFTYIVRPTIASGDAGFDRIEIQSVSPLGPVAAVRLGDVPVLFGVEVAEPNRLVVSVPRLEPADSGALVEIDFDARILRYGSSFEGRVWDSVRPLEVPQRIHAGDATGEFEGNRVSVATATVDEGELVRLRLEPAVMTPNGDGRNDVARLIYDIFEITGVASLHVEVWDLAGRRVRLLYEGADGIGVYERGWDGRDDAGRLMPPGVYLGRVSMETDTEHVEDTRVVHLVY